MKVLWYGLGIVLTIAFIVGPSIRPKQNTGRIVSLKLRAHTNAITVMINYHFNEVGPPFIWRIEQLKKKEWTTQCEFCISGTTRFRHEGYRQLTFNFDAKSIVLTKAEPWSENTYIFRLTVTNLITDRSKVLDTWIEEKE